MKRIQIVCSPWVESPELALVVTEAEGSTPSHVSNLDALSRVKVVPGELGVLLNRTGWVKICSHTVSMHCNGGV